MKKMIVCMIFASMSMCIIGCKPYKEPMYSEIGSNETAFLIPLEGSSMNQDSFESAEYLKQNKVAARRVEITRRWKQTGRLWFNGEYIDTVRLIKVDRSPKTRNWQAGNKQSIWVESRDSVGFSIDMTVVAQIHPDDVPQFLYLYPSTGGTNRLDDVLDTEVRAFIQDRLARECAKYDMDILRTMKNEMMDTVRAEAIPYFASRGITITTIGMGSGFAYESKDIQDAIDKVVQAQQDKSVAQAEQQAQAIRNQTDIDRAEAARQVAQVQADARNYEITQAKQSGPEYIELLRIQAWKEWIEKWNGVRPRVELSGSGSGTGILLGLDSESE